MRESEVQLDAISECLYPVLSVKTPREDAILYETLLIFERRTNHDDESNDDSTFINIVTMYNSKITRQQNHY